MIILCDKNDFLIGEFEINGASEMDRLDNIFALTQKRDSLAKYNNDNYDTFRCGSKVVYNRRDLRKFNVLGDKIKKNISDATIVLIDGEKVEQYLIESKYLNSISFFSSILKKDDIDFNFTDEISNDFVSSGLYYNNNIDKAFSNLRDLFVKEKRNFDNLDLAAFKSVVDDGIVNFSVKEIISFKDFSEMFDGDKKKIRDVLHECVNNTELMGKDKLSLFREKFMSDNANKKIK